MGEAPICFGAVTRFGIDSVFCSECSHKEGCAEAVQRTIEALAPALDVASLLERHRALKKPKQKPEPAIDPGTLVKKGPAALAAAELEKRKKEEAKKLTVSILRMLLKGMKREAFIKAVAGGQNPHDKATHQEQWAICALLQVKVSPERWMKVLDVAVPNETRRGAIIQVLIAADILKEEGELLALKNES